MRMQWGNVFSGLSEETDRHPYDLWYRGEDGSQNKGNDRVFPSLYVIKGSLKKNKEIYDFAETIVDAFDLAASASKANKKAKKDIQRPLLSVHDILHCAFDFFPGGHPTSGPRQGELIVFLPVDLKPRDLEQKLESALETILDHPDVDLARVGPPVAATNAASGPRAGLEFVQKYLDPRVKRTKTKPGPKVVSVVVDHAIGFANSRFCHQRNTRFLGFWSQQIEDIPPCDTQENPFAIGKNFYQPEIQAFLSELGGADCPNEVSLYRKAGLLDRPTPKSRGADALRLSTGHGTQVLDLVAGDDPFEPVDFVSDEHGILAVQLPSDLVSRTNGFLTELFVKSALNWVWFMITLVMDTDAKVVLNFSFSAHSGRHDGQDIIEADLDRRMAKGEIDYVTLPAGNSYLSRTHAIFHEQNANAEWQDVEFVVQPDGKDPVFLQVYCDGVVQPQGLMPLLVQVIGPDGSASLGKTACEGQFEKTENGEARIYYQVDRPKYLMERAATPRTAISVAINPTNCLFHPDQTPATPGLWRIRIKAAATLPKQSTIDLWIERGESLAGFPARGRQAYFTHPEYRLFRADGRLNESDTNDSPIRRAGTLNSFGTGKHTCVVASVRAKDGYASYFSAASRSRSAVNNKPSFGVFAESSHARPNVLATGILSGSTVFSSGSSFACARAARVASLAALNPQNGTIDAQVRSQLRPPPIHFAARYGQGTIEAADLRRKMPISSKQRTAP